MKTRLKEVRDLQKIAGLISEYEKVDIGGGRYKDDEGNIGGGAEKTLRKKGEMTDQERMTGQSALKFFFKGGDQFVIWAAKNANDRRHFENILNKKLKDNGFSVESLASSDQRRYQLAKQVIDEVWSFYSKKEQPKPTVPPQAPTTEALSIDAMDRMDGLVSQRAVSQLIGGAQQIIKDLKADGFDDEDIFDYIMERIKVLA